MNLNRSMINTWWAAFVMALLLCLCAPVLSQGHAGSIQVVATTTMMQSAIKDVAGNRVKVTVLIPGGSCPGQYDIRPGDIEALRKSRILFVHGFEGFVPKLGASAGLPESRITKIPAARNWQLPDAYLAACRLVASTISRVDASNRTEYMHRLTAIETQTRAVDKSMAKQSRELGISGVPVICSDQQAEVLRWMGLRVIGTYGRPEEFSPSTLHALAQRGRSASVKLIVDSLQSGSDAGVELARELGAKHIVLSNFPGGFNGTPTWARTVRENVRRVIQALGKSYGR